MTIGIYLQAAPWAVPAWLLGSLVVLLVSGPLARRLGWGWVEVVALGTTVVGYLAVTTTPNPRLGRPMSTDRSVSLDAVWVRPGQLFNQASEPGLNVWIAVPMAAVAAYVLLRRQQTWPVVLVLVLPPLAEGVQLAFPPLGRSAFLLGDVTANWQGVVLGLVVGLVTAAAVVGREREGAGRG